MNFSTLVWRGLAWHWRAHLGVLLGAAVAAAVLTGALLVGDSVRGSLTALNAARIGQAGGAWFGGEHYFRQVLAGPGEAPAILTVGSASLQSGRARANQVQILGVDENFWKLSPGGHGPALAPGHVALNRRLAAQLGLKEEDVDGVPDDKKISIVLRIAQPHLLPRDAPLSPEEDAAAAVTLKVDALVGDDAFGRFSLQANQVPPYIAYLPLAQLQARLNKPAHINLLLTPSEEKSTRAWTLEDYELDVRLVPQRYELEVRTARIFLDDTAGAAARAAAPNGHGVLTYLVNRLKTPGHTTPYSMVAAMEGDPVPADLGDDEIVLNEWLAEDLAAKSGDEVQIDYFVLGALRKLEERSHTFKVREIVPIAGAADDRELMPPFPGIAKATSCTEWDPGFEIDKAAVRKKDEAYWDAHKGLPKAFISLNAGQKLWRNRFGGLTALRVPLKPNPIDNSHQEIGALSGELLRALTPEKAGLNWFPLREMSAQSTGQALDFGQLFLGFSFFLIVAALLLVALLFGLGAELRAAETGTLLALGFRQRTVRRLLLVEGLALSVAGAHLGMFGAVYYARAIIWGLSNVWSGAVAGGALSYHATWQSLLIGTWASVIVAGVALTLVVRKQARQPARELLVSKFSGGAVGNFRAPRLSVALAILCALGAVALSGWAWGKTGAEAAGPFFGAGGLLLLAALALTWSLLTGLGRASSKGALSLAGLGVRSLARRRGRSLAVAGLLACGAFLVAAVGAMRLDASGKAARRDSGTGGFAFYGQSAIGVVHDLNVKAGREHFALNPKDLDGVSVLPLRLHEGDDASCLNLNRAQRPQILGIDPQGLAERKAFTFGNTTSTPRVDNPWLLLEADLAGEIPVIGDEATLQWGLEKKVGDTLEYPDERGRPVKLRIVGALSHSILQGSLVISGGNFEKLFPGESGYRIFLIDAPSERQAQAAEVLSRALQDMGLELIPAPRRLAEFDAVQNTYLSTFQALGGLGLLLGSLGLGIVVLRNVWERRGELAVLRAQGFTRATLSWLVLSEHAALLGLGLACGIGSALLAVLPALKGVGGEAPGAGLWFTLAAVCLNGLLWAFVAARLALRGTLLEALRAEEA